ncbi:MAG TPA: hypothetical protein PLX08_10150 [Bacteroidales bacterium]|jgi:hypothetical protein|nr:hypothetical protein [Bacteroidales bacterium]
MRKIVITLTLFIFFTLFASAQDYNTGVGLRLGFSNGLTVKHFLSQRSAVEGLLSTRWHGFELTGLYEVHDNAFDVDRLNWYFGGGAHVGFWNGDYTYDRWGAEGKQYVIIGVDGILGIEYNFTEIPINISLDWKPSFNLTGYSGFWGDGGALSIRYIF